MKKANMKINRKRCTESTKWHFPSPKEILEYLEQDSYWEGLYQKTRYKSIGIKELLQKSQEENTL